MCNILSICEFYELIDYCWTANQSSFQVAIQLLYSKTIIDILDEAEEDMDTDENPAEDDEDDESTKDDDDNVMYRNSIHVPGFSVVIFVI